MARKVKLPREPVTAQIEKLSHDGRGIAYINGKATFIEGALPGETVSFHYTLMKGKFAEGLVHSVIVAAHNRITPKCAVYDLCGGCNLQHLAPDAQIAHKQAVLAEQLQHFGKVVPKAWLPPLQANSWGYRRKARLGARHVSKKGGALVGFREKNGRFLVDMQACEVLHPLVGKKIHILREWLNTLEGVENIPQFEVAIDDTHVALIMRHLKPLSAKDMVNIKAFAAREDFWFYLQPHGPDSIHRIWPESGEASLCYTLPQYQINIRFAPSDFTQVNQDINLKMVDLAMALLKPEKTDSVLDLFCGLGNFTLPIARLAKSVFGVEGDASMTRLALENAQLNGISNVRYEAANLFEDVSDKAFMQNTYDKILLDPPRAGAEAIVKQFGRLKARRIVYVSCNPATLARDAGILVNESGFTLETVGVMDMFPHTAHVESIALFSKGG